MTNEEQQAVLAIKNAILELPPAQGEQCYAMVFHIRRMIKDAGEPLIVFQIQ